MKFLSVSGIREKDWRGNSGGGFDHDALFGRFIPKGKATSWGKPQNRERKTGDRPRKTGDQISEIGYFVLFGSVKKSVFRKRLEGTEVRKFNQTANAKDTSGSEVVGIVGFFDVSGSRVVNI